MLSWLSEDSTASKFGPSITAILVGLLITGCPLILALVTTIGPLRVTMSWLIVVLLATLMAIVPSLWHRCVSVLLQPGNSAPGFTGSTNVRPPGQKRSANFCALFEKTAMLKA